MRWLPPYRFSAAVVCSLTLVWYGVGVAVGVVWSGVAWCVVWVWV